MLKKLIEIIKISVYCVVGIAFLVFFVLIIEPNDTFETKATMTPGENPLINTKNCPNNPIFKKWIKWKVAYCDQIGRRIITTDRYFSNIDSAQQVNKIINCQISVRYSMGRWFGDRSWAEPDIGDLFFKNDCSFKK